MSAPKIKNSSFKIIYKKIFIKVLECIDDQGYPKEGENK
jgi:hypothetical protein